MRRVGKQAMTNLWFLLFVCGFTVQVSAAPEYVTAWPRQVPVEWPDPVLGDKPYWEHWVYSESFARRFVGTADGQQFSVEKADPELKGKLHALVLRIYKKNLWAGVNDDYPEQYTCEIEMYFDDSIAIPLSKTRLRQPYADYPDGVRAGYAKLISANGVDADVMQSSKPVEMRSANRALIFAMPVDGRMHFYGIGEYRRSLVPGISMTIFRVGWSAGGCNIAAPQRPEGSDWISLGMVHPFTELKTAVFSTYDRRYESRPFDPGPDPESQGLFRIPRAFHEVALQKAALVKVLNWCIWARHAHANPHPRSNMTPEVWKRMAYRCEQAERHGRILPDPRYHPDADGLMDTGY